jgi:hypothetical protein
LLDRRELSTKVFAGQCRLVRKGYKAGGAAGYGLRRLLLAADGTPKTVLEHGDRKWLTTERVTYTLGPPTEVRTVRKIYSLLLNEGLDCYAIARWLNEHGVLYKRGPWNGQTIYAILTHPKYAGSLVFNRHSQRLRSKKTWNPPEQWVIQPNSFPAIISQKRFRAAQRKLNDRVIRRSNERLLEELRKFVGKHGRATQLMLAQDRNMASACAYGKRFGSFSRALALAMNQPDSDFSEIEWRARLKLRLQDEFAEAMAARNIKSHRRNGTFRSASHPPLLLDVACCRVLKNGQSRWEIRYPLTGVEGLHCITLRLDVGNKVPLDYLILRVLPPGNQRYRFSEERLQELKASAHRTLLEAVTVLLEENGKCASHHRATLARHDIPAAGNPSLVFHLVPVRTRRR